MQEKGVILPVIDPPDTGIELNVTFATIGLILIVSMMAVVFKKKEQC